MQFGTCTASVNVSLLGNIGLCQRSANTKVAVYEMSDGLGNERLIVADRDFCAEHGPLVADSFRTPSHDVFLTLAQCEAFETNTPIQCFNDADGIVRIKQRGDAGLTFALIAACTSCYGEIENRVQALRQKLPDAVVTDWEVF